MSIEPKEFYEAVCGLAIEAIDWESVDWEKIFALLLKILPLLLLLFGI